VGSCSVSIFSGNRYPITQNEMNVGLVMQRLIVQKYLLFSYKETSEEFEVSQSFYRLSRVELKCLFFIESYS
jgi:hypothetical protein